MVFCCPTVGAAAGVLFRITAAAPGARGEIGAVGAFSCMALMPPPVCTGVMLPPTGVTGARPDAPVPMPPALTLV